MHQLRRPYLSNFEIDSYNALTVLICGREELSMQFGLSILEPLANSISLTINLEGLPKEESFAYIEGRLQHCGNFRTIARESTVLSRVATPSYREAKGRDLCGGNRLSYRDDDIRLIVVTHRRLTFSDVGVRIVPIISTVTGIYTPPPIASSMLPVQEGDGKPHLRLGKRTYPYGPVGTNGKPRLSLP